MEALEKLLHDHATRPAEGLPFVELADLLSDPYVDGLLKVVLSPTDARRDLTDDMDFLLERGAAELSLLGDATDDLNDATQAAEGSNVTLLPSAEKLVHQDARQLALTLMSIGALMLIDCMIGANP